MLTKSQKKSECTGCHACRQVCPVNAIDMVEDVYGFLEPVINYDICILCKKCKYVCQFLTDRYITNDISHVYAGVSKAELAKNSTTSGVFAFAALKIMENGGVVFGAGFDLNSEHIVRHIYIENSEELYKLQGSKYVESYLGDTFSICKQFLDSKRVVLFSGTPCQVSALKMFLGMEYDNLYTIDIVCHGTPSRKMFTDYMRMLVGTGKITSIKFRDKNIDLSHNLHYIIDKNGKHIEKKESGYCTSYYYNFLKCETYRESCYNCKFAKAPTKRAGDLSLCDYWGFSEVHKEYMLGNKELIHESISGILVNTDKGEKMLDSINKDLKLYKSDFESVSKYNDVLKAPSMPGEYRKEIMDLYASDGYKAVEFYFNSHKRKNFYMHKLFFKLPKKAREGLRYALWGGITKK